MGDDYGHGVAAADDDGDPNVPPRQPVAPSIKVGGADVTQTAITVRFKAQKQFLTKLVIECMPTKKIPNYGKPESAGQEFKAFATTDAVGGRIVQPAEATTATEAVFTGLKEGTQYTFRLVATNPSGTARSNATKGTFTFPKTPPAPKFGKAQLKALMIKFKKQGRAVTKLGIEMALLTKKSAADPFGPANKKKGMVIDGSKNVGIRTTGLVRGLEPGKQYVFRLVVSNKSGSSTGPVSKPFMTLPKAPFAPREDSSKRTDSTIGLHWHPLGDSISKLALQYAQLNGKTTFQDVAKNGGKTIRLEDPTKIKEFLVDGLEADKSYVFRMIATNSSGQTAGQIMGPIKTVTFTPDMLDKSGWLTEVVDMKAATKKAKTRKGTKGGVVTKGEMKCWYTLDGKLLTWSRTIGGEEVDFLHLGKVAKVVQNARSHAVEITLKSSDPKKAKVLILTGESDDPNVSNAQLMASWVTALIKAITGDKAVTAALKEAKSSVAATGGGGAKAAILPDELSDSEPEEEEDDGDGFGGGADEEDEEEEEDGDGFGAGADEEDETGGFEVEEAFGGMDDEEEDEEEDEDGFGGGFGGEISEEESDEEATGF